MENPKGKIMRVAVLTATKRPGGLDVTYNTLVRQTHHDIVWIVADDLFQERQHIFREEVKAFPAYHFQPHHDPGYYSNLPVIYNDMLSAARGYGCELAVSLQDYIWIPPTGIEQFVNLTVDHPRALLTGLCSMLAEPPSAAIYRRNGLWTIFSESYKGPRLGAFIAWSDVREQMHAPGLSACSPQHWEMNWAAIPLIDPKIRREITLSLRFDAKYGAHIGHENQQFATEWSRAGYPILIDTQNHALSLPHRVYFIEEWESQMEHRMINHRIFEEEYGE